MPPPISDDLDGEVQGIDATELPRGVIAESDIADGYESGAEDSEPQPPISAKQMRNRRRQVKGKSATRRSTRIRSASEQPLDARQKQQLARSKRKSAMAGKARSTGGQQWEVESIVESRIDAETFTHYYYVKWKGYSPKYNTWEPKINLHNCAAALKSYEMRSKKAGMD